MMTKQMMSKDFKRKSIILGAVGLLLIVAIAITLASNSFVQSKNDFFTRWYRTVKLFDERRNLYDSQTSGDELTELDYGDFSGRKLTNFHYPAHLLVFTVPLALLEYSTALFIWLVLIQLFYFIGLWLEFNTVDWPMTLGYRTWYLVAALFFLPFIQQLIWAQFNTIAVLFLALTIMALRRQRFFLAGLSAVGLTFKPQGTGLLLVFLLLWALLQRRRWAFLLGFALASFFMWAAAEFFQPNWVPLFLSSLKEYVPTRSVMDRYWNPFQLSSLVLILMMLVMVILNRDSKSDTPIFASLLALSFGIWALIVPIVGMMHMVLLPAILIIFFAGIKKVNPLYHRLAIWSFGLVYVLGWVGFLIGILVPDWYGFHVRWSELMYKVLVPILLVLFSIPLCFQRSRVILSPSYDS